MFQTYSKTFLRLDGPLTALQDTYVVTVVLKSFMMDVLNASPLQAGMSEILSCMLFSAQYPVIFDMYWLPPLRMGHLLAEVLFGTIGLCYLFLDLRLVFDSSMVAMGKGGRKGGKGGKGKGKGRREGEDGPKALGVSSELHTAAREGDVQKIEALLSDAPGADGDGGVRPVNAPDQHRRSPLHMAAFFGKAEAVQKLLEKSADPHLQDTDESAMDGFLPLHFAAQSGHLEVGERFGGPAPNGSFQVAKGKKSALHLALLKGHQDCARFLVMTLGPGMTRCGWTQQVPVSS
eukprot:g13288.t1